MALLFHRKRPAVLGVDLGAAAVKVLELSRSAEGLRVEGFASVAIAPGLITDNTIQDVAALGAALTLALAQAKVSAAHAAIALPATLVISKTLQVDATLPEEELEATMQLEAASSISFPLTEVYRDFAVLGLHEKDPAKMDVLLVAARRAPVDTRVLVLHNAGLSVDCVEVETFTMERVVNYLNLAEDKTIAVIQVSAAMITLTVIYRKRVIYSREELCGNAATLDVDLLMPLLRRFLQLFLSSASSHTIDQIWLTGEGAHTMGLCDRIAESLAISCGIMQPLHTMSLAATVDAAALAQAAPSLALACGLALRGMINHDRD